MHSMTQEKKLEGIVVKLISYDRGLKQPIRCPICRGSQTEPCPGYCTKKNGQEIWYPCENGRIHLMADSYHTDLELPGCKSSQIVCRLCTNKQSGVYQGVMFGESEDGFVAPFHLVVLRKIKKRWDQVSDPGLLMSFAIFERNRLSQNGQKRTEQNEWFIVGPLSWNVQGPRVVPSAKTFWRTWILVGEEIGIPSAVVDDGRVLGQIFTVGKLVTLRARPAMISKQGKPANP